MHHIYDTETMREHRQALIAEAENARLARQLKEVRRNSGKAHSGRTQLRAVLLLSTVALAILFAASAAYALDVQCPPSVGGAVCFGTDANDVMLGTGGIDSIVGLGGDDVIHGLASPDRLTGDGNGTIPGDDQLFGGAGSDDLVGGAGSDLLSGDREDDGISADYLFSDGIDTVEGGPGDDTVRAVEGQRDVIDCGPGRDRVDFDSGLDSVKRCEIKEAS